MRALRHALPRFQDPPNFNYTLCEEIDSDSQQV